MAPDGQSTLSTGALACTCGEPMILEVAFCNFIFQFSLCQAVKQILSSISNLLVVKQHIAFSVDDSKCSSRQACSILKSHNEWYVKFMLKSFYKTQTYLFNL